MSAFKNILLLLILFSFNVSQGQKDGYGLADSLEAAQDYFGAYHSYASIYEADTSDKKAVEGMASSLYILGDLQLSKEYYHRLESLEDYKSIAVTRLASIYETQQNVPKAIKYNIALTKLYPNNPVYHRKLGSLYLQGNETTQATASFKLSNLINPRDLITIQQWAELYISMDSIVEAEVLLATGLTIDSTHIGLSLLMSRVKYRLRDYLAVTRILSSVSNMSPLNNYYHKVLGYAYLQIDSLDKSIFYLQRSLLNEGDPEYALFYLAMAHEKKKDSEAALYFYKEALAAGISENIPYYHKGLARIYATEGKYKEVIHQYSESLKYQKDNSVYFYMANAAEQYYKDKSKAIYYYQQYLSGQPDDNDMIKTAENRIKVLKEYQFMSR